MAITEVLSRRLEHYLQIPENVKQRTNFSGIEIDGNLIKITLTNEHGVNNEAVTALAKALLADQFAVTDFDSTNGLVFVSNKAKDAVLAAKREENLNRPFGLVSRIDDILPWIDLDQIHPEFRSEKMIKKLAKLTQDIGFLRVPTHTPKKFEAMQAVSDGQIQVFFKPDNDPLLTELCKLNPTVSMYPVTSANITGTPELFDPQEALAFAKATGAWGFVVNNEASLTHSHTREKLGSTPIIQLPRTTDINYYTGGPIIYITRAANTHPYSVERMIKEEFPYMMVQYRPTKKEALRKQYSFPHTQQKNLHQTLWEAGLPKKA